MSTHAIQHQGKSFPLGSTLVPGGANFSVFAKYSTGAQLLLFDDTDAPERRLGSSISTRGTIAHTTIGTPSCPGVTAGQIYAYRVSGPFDPVRGLRFDPTRCCSILMVNASLGRPAAAGRQLDTPATMRRRRSGTWSSTRAPMTGRVIRLSGGLLPRRSSTRCMSAGSPGIRARASAPAKARHLRRVDRQDPLSAGPRRQRGRASAGVCLRRAGRSAGPRQLLGLSAPVVFAPHDGYSSRSDPLGAIDEFRDMVKALHRAGIEVILDVVYNHTAEGGADGPTICFRGLANDTYYILAEDKSRYADYTGCGNTLNANEPIVRRLILDSLRYWVSEMHVDGFRFDLASILARDQQGRPMASPPILWDIEIRPGPRQCQADRRGLGRRRPLSGRQFCRRQLEGMERAVSRRYEVLPQGRQWNRPCPGVPADGEPGRLPARRARSRAKHQFRDLPRRVHAQRSGLLQQQAQRSERRGKPRRSGSQSQLELRCRRSDRRIRRWSGCAFVRSRTS